MNIGKSKSKGSNNRKTPAVGSPRSRGNSSADGVTPSGGTVVAENKGIITHLLAEIMAHSSDPVFIKDTDLRYVCCSPRFAELVGRDIADIAGLCDDELFPPQTAQKLRTGDCMLLLDGVAADEIIERETVVTDAVVDGRPGTDNRYSYSLSRHLLYDTEGAVIGIYGSGKDVTLQRHADEAARIRELEAEIALSQVGKTVLFYDIASCALTLPTYYAEFHRLRTTITVNDIVSDRRHLPASERAAVRDFFDAVSRGRHNATVEMHLLCRDGLRTHERAEAHIIRSDNGTPVRAVIAVSDLTEQNASLETREILSKLDEGYSGMYMLDTVNDRVVPLKMSSEVGSLVHDSYIEWSRKFEDIVAGLVYPKYRRSLKDLISRDRVSCGFSSSDEKRETVYQLTGGAWRKMVVTPLAIEDGVTLRALMTITDITEVKRQTDALFEQRRAGEKRVREYERLLFDSAADVYSSILKLDLDGDAAYSIGFSDGIPVETQLRESLSDYFVRWLDTVHEDDRQAVSAALYGGDLGRMEPGGRVRFTYRKRVRGAGFRWYTTTVRMAGEIIPTGGGGADDAGGGVVLTDRGPHMATAFTVDINDDMNERVRLKDLSEHDGLTDLFNRVKFEAMVDGEYRSLNSCGVLFFDVNYLKRTNDTSGHEAGNTLLCQVADSIRSITNRRIHGYRYGGDEFIVVVCNGDENELDLLLQMWRSRLDALSADSGLQASVAAGKAWSGSPLTVQRLISLADEDMYRVKREMKKR